MSDNVITIPSHVRTFEIGSDTLKHFNFDNTKGMKKVMLKIFQYVTYDICIGLQNSSSFFFAH